MQRIITRIMECIRFSPLSCCCRRFSTLQQELYRIYHESKVCLEVPSSTSDGNSGNFGSEISNFVTSCEHGEPELAKRMESVRDPKFLYQIWRGWREAVGGPSQGAKLIYGEMIEVMNEASRNNGERTRLEPF